MGATEDRRYESGVPLFRRSDRTCVGLPAADAAVNGGTGAPVGEFDVQDFLGEVRAARSWSEALLQERLDENPVACAVRVSLSIAQDEPLHLRLLALLDVAVELAHALGPDDGAVREALIRLVEDRTR